jgi:hypothetical protein
MSVPTACPTGYHQVSTGRETCTECTQGKFDCKVWQQIFLNQKLLSLLIKKMGIHFKHLTKFAMEK